MADELRRKQKFEAARLRLCEDYESFARMRSSCPAKLLTKRARKFRDNVSGKGWSEFRFVFAASTRKLRQDHDTC